MAPDDRRRAIVEALVPVVLDRGVDLSTKEIAEAAQVAEGTLFRVFPDKRSLVASTVLEAARQHFTADCPPMRPVVDLPQEAGLADRLEVVVEHVMSRAGRSVRIIALLHDLDPAYLPDAHGGGAFRPQRTFASSAEYREHRSSLDAWVTDLLGDHVRELSVPVGQLVDVVRAMVIGGRVPPHGAHPLLTADQIVHILLHGVVTAPAPSSSSEPSTLHQEPPC